MFGLLVYLVGCSTAELEPSRTVIIINSDPGEPLPFTVSSPCGGIVMREPLANLSGSFSVPVKRGAPVYLYTTPQRSTRSVVEKLGKCPPIDKTVVEKDGSFTFLSYPAGDYVVMAPTGTFRGEATYPLIRESEDSAVRVQAVSNLVTEKYTLTVVSIEPVEKRGRRTSTQESGVDN